MRHGPLCLWEILLLPGDCCWSPELFLCVWGGCPSTASLEPTAPAPAGRAAVCQVKALPCWMVLDGLRWVLFPGVQAAVEEGPPSSGWAASAPFVVLEHGGGGVGLLCSCGPSSHEAAAGWEAAPVGDCTGCRLRWGEACVFRWLLSRLHLLQPPGMASGPVRPWESHGPCTRLLVGAGVEQPPAFWFCDPTVPRR